MVHGDGRGQPLGQEPLNHILVELHTDGVGPVNAVLALREDSWPGDGQAERVETELVETLDVLFPPVLELICFITRLVLVDVPVALVVGEVVPNGHLPPIFVPRALDLVGF